VATLNSHLHEIGSGIAWTGAADLVAGDRMPISDRLGEAADRLRESTLGFLTRGGTEPADATAQVAATGGARGASVGAAGGLAKLASTGAIPKLVAACVGTGAATACVASGVAPISFPDTSGPAKVEQAAEHRPGNRARPSWAPTTFPTQVAHEAPAPRPAIEDDKADQTAPDTTVEAAPEPSPAPPIEQEFGLAPAGSPTGDSATTATSGSSAGVGGGSDGSGGAVAQEFGP
jgi:hypothetical protein